MQTNNDNLSYSSEVIKISDEILPKLDQNQKKLIKKVLGLTEKVLD